MKAAGVPTACPRFSHGQGGFAMVCSLGPARSWPHPMGRAAPRACAARPPPAVSAACLGREALGLMMRLTVTVPRTVHVVRTEC